MIHSHSIHLSYDEALAKAQKYCAYQERCVEDVKTKMSGWHLNNNQILNIISNLEKEGFLSDMQFAELYVKSKINQNKWGRIKIEAELKLRNISNEIIAEQIAMIDVDAYSNNIRSLINNKLKDMQKFGPSNKKLKLTRYLLSKGYEPEIIISFIKQIVNVDKD
jgi:regulatory protein